MVDETGKQLGIQTFYDALKMAQDKSLDLVEVSSSTIPPVCKIMDYGKYVFEEKKKEKEQKRAQRKAQSDLKEIQVSPVIQDGDLNVKIKHIQRIINEGDKVKVTIKFAGRQIRHAELGKDIFEKVITALPEVIVEKAPVFEGKSLFIILNRA